MHSQLAQVEQLYKRLDAKNPGQLRAIHQFMDVPQQQFACAENEHWVAVTTSSFNIHQMRQAYLANADDITSVPIVISAENFPLYLKINPVAAEQLTHGPYFGQNGILATVPAAKSDEKTAHFAMRLLQASPIITQRCYEDRIDSAETQLTTLKCGFNINAERPIDQFCQMQRVLADWQGPIPQEPNRADAPACLPELQAIYDELDSAILVLPHNAADIIAKTDWTAVADHFADKFLQLQITTTSQLKLLAHHHMAISFAIKRFKHVWGADVLSETTLSHQHIAQSALRFVLNLGCAELPQKYLTLPEDEIGKLIHDVQNQLLKVQLQYDLLTFMHGLPRGGAPQLVSTREMAIADRIDAILKHINHWVDYYKTLLQTSV